MSSGIKTTVENAVAPQWTLGRHVRLPQCTVVVESGPDAGQRFGPLREVTTIGREIYCDIGLSDTAVSKVHCELSSTDQGLRLRDLGSTNGTESLEKEVWDVILPPGKTFKIGQSTLRAEIEGSIHTFRSRPMDETSKLAGASPPMRSLFAAMERVAQRT